MTDYVTRRLLHTVPTLLGAVTAVFLLIRLVPGDPALAVLGPYATKEAVLDLRQAMGLDRPLGEQYLAFLFRVLRGDFGESLSAKVPVMLEVLRLFPQTLSLAVAGTLVALAIGVPIGVVSAVHRKSLLDHVLRSVALAGVSLPVFFLSVVLLYFFSYRLGWFPAIGAGEAGNMLSVLHHLVLPAFAVGIYMAALISRMTRSCVLEVTQEDYVRTARAKGLTERVVIYRHVLRNAMIPVLTVVGLSAGQLLAGAVLTESVFARPGLGGLILDAILTRDYPMVQGGVLFFATMVIAVNLVVDLLYGALDPTVSYR